MAPWNQLNGRCRTCGSVVREPVTAQDAPDAVYCSTSCMGLRVTDAMLLGSQRGRTWQHVKELCVDGRRCALTTRRAEPSHG